jgi:hypothetical protein
MYVAVSSGASTDLPVLLLLLLSLTLPPQSPSLQELYLSKTGLSGLLPDVVPRNSSLKALYIIGPFDQERTDPTNPGVIGEQGREGWEGGWVQCDTVSDVDPTLF